MSIRTEDSKESNTECKTSSAHFTFSNVQICWGIKHSWKKAANNFGFCGTWTAENISGLAPGVQEDIEQVA